MMLSATGVASLHATDCPEVKLPKTDGPQEGHTPSRLLSYLILSILTSEEDQSETDRCASACQLLTKHLASLSPGERSELSSTPQVQHYLHRLVQHAAKHEKHNELVAKLAEYFPSKIKDYQEKELTVSYSYTDVQRSGNASTRRDASSLDATQSTTTAVTGMDIYHYDPSTLAATFRAPRLTLEDVRRASAAVATEVRTLERAICDSEISPSKRNRSVGWYDTRNIPTRLPPSGVSARLSHDVISRSERTQLVPVLHSDLNDPHFLVSKTGTSLFPRKQRRSSVPLYTGPVSAAGVPLRTAFDVIEAFASGQLRAESESIYLNYTHPDRCTPYDLSVTPRTKVMLEHFVISNFGILHVYPDGMSDFQTFADWLREASMFTLMRQIPFFREYRMKHVFRRWHQAVRSTQMHRLSVRLNRICIRFFPVYADALVKLKHLSEELLTVSFHHLRPLGGYTMESMEHSLQGSQIKARHLLLKYFKYCRREVSGAVEASRKHAGDLEAEHHQQHFVPEVPLSIQKKRHEKLERDLAAATYQRDRIGDFVGLAEQVVYSCLLQLARDWASSWKELFLCPILKQASSGFQIRREKTTGGKTAPSSKQDELNQGEYFLFSSLIIDSSGKVTTDPQSSKIKELFTAPLHDMSELLTSSVHQLDQPPPPPPGMGPPGPVSSRLSSRDVSTRLSNNTQMPPLEPHPQHAASRQSNRVSIIDHRETKAKFHDIPPSLAVAKQPKTVLKALRGIPHDGRFSFTAQEQELASRTARHLLEASDASAGVAEDQGAKGRRSLLSRDKFMENMQNDKCLQQDLRELEAASEKVSRQMDSICQEYGWLARVWHFNNMWRVQQWDVWEFIRGWSHSQRGDAISQERAEGEGEGGGYNSTQLAYEFEVALNQIYKWRNQFVAFPADILTPYAMLCISSSGLVEFLCSMLDSIRDQVKSAAIKRSRLLCEKVLEETKRRAEVLNSKRYDLEGFAEYARHLRESHAFQSRERDNITFVLKVHSILQRQGIQVPQADKELGRELNEVWHAFEQKLGEADQFVAKQTPIKAQGLQESILSSEEELRALVKRVHEGEFVDPTQDPSHLIALLDGINKEVGAVHARLLGLSKWKEAITGLPHDLSNVNSLLDQLYVRQELWKYRRHFDLYEKEWMNSAFKKLDISAMSIRIDDWLGVCLKLEETLGFDDPVLKEWRTRLTSFKKGMPLLVQLSSDYLRPSHWVTIFAALGEDYDPARQYTLMDFSLYNIYDHTDIIFEICYDAMQGEKLKSKVQEIQQELESLKISISQMALECYPFALPTDTPTHAHAHKITFQSPSAAAKEVSISEPAPPPPQRKGATFAVGLASPSDSSARYLYEVENGAEVLMRLESSGIQLEVHLASPHLGPLRQKAEALLDTVSKLRELVSLLLQCQEQWLHLLSLVKAIKPRLQKTVNLPDLQRAGAKFQDVAKSIRIDPRLQSLLEKRRGQKGFRELQGDALRATCSSIQQLLASTMLSVQDLLSQGIEEFPRLCYLSERDLLTAISNRGDPVPIIPIIRKVFPGVSNIRFTEIMPSKNTLSLAPTLTSTGDESGFQILIVVGWQREQLSLCVPLPLGKRPASEWLRALEYAISYSLASGLTETYASLPAHLKGGVDVLTEQHAGELMHWLKRRLNQCVLLAMEMHWTLVLHSALTSDEPIEQLKLASAKLSSAVDCVCEVLMRRGEGGHHLRSTAVLLQHLILCLRRKAEMVSALIAEDVCTPESFRWRTQLQYSSEMENLYTLPDHPGALHRPTLGHDQCTSISSSYSNLGAGSRHNMKGRSSPMPLPPPTPGVRVQESGSLVGSSRSLLGSRANLLANASVASATRSRSIGGVPMPLKCFVHCYQSTVPYGFEFLGAGSQLVLTPQTESSLLSLVNAVASHAYPSIGSTAPSARTAGRDVAVALGRHLYTVDCCLLRDPASLRRLVFGALHTGSLLQLDGLHFLPRLLMLQLAQWLETVTTALAAIPPPSFPVRQRQESIAGGGHIGSSVRLTTPAAPPTHRESIVIESSADVQQEIGTSGASRASEYSNQPTDPSQLLSQQSLRTLHSRATERPRGSSRVTATSSRMDWYHVSQEPGLLPPPLAEGSAVAAVEVVGGASGWYGYGGEMRRQVRVAEEQVLSVSPAFGCILMTGSAECSVPQQLKSNFRPVEVLEPSWTYLCEALLVSHGFSAAQDLAPIISHFLHHLRHQLLSTSPDVSAAISPSTLRRLVRRAAQLLHSGAYALDEAGPGLQLESRCLGASVLQHFAPQLAVGRGGGEGEGEEEEEEEEELSGFAQPRTDSTGWRKLRELLRSSFLSSSESDVETASPEELHTVPPELVDAIKTQLKERHLQRLPSLIEKVKQVHLALQHSKCALLSGPSGSGKTTCFKILAAAYQQVREVQALANQSARASGNQQEESHDIKYPTISMTFLNPAAYTMDELLGSEKEVSRDGQPAYSMWEDGVLTTCLRGVRASEERRATNLHPDVHSLLQPLASSCAHVKHWLVLDGPVSPLLSQLLHHLVTDEGVTLRNGDKLRLPESCQVIVESPSLDNVTPSLLRSCSLVHCSRDTLSFNTLVNTWLDRAPTQHNISAISAETLAIMIRQLLPETLDYLARANMEYSGEAYTVWSMSQVFGLTETQCFLGLLSAVLERNAPKEDWSSSQRGTGSYGSRGSSVMSTAESRAGSAMMARSTTSIQTETSYDYSELTPGKHSAMLGDNLSEVSHLETELALSLQVQMAAMLAFAYIWSLGAFVPYSDLESFSELARELIMQLPYAVPLPEEGSVFDYFLDLKMYQFLPWAERKQEPHRSPEAGYVAMPELERFAYIADLYISYGFDVMLTGERGGGKTSFVENLLKNRMSVSHLPIHYLSTPAQLQSGLLEKLSQLERKLTHQRWLGSSRKSQQKSIFFLDDIHLAPESSATEEGEGEGELLSRPPDFPLLELVRYMLTHRRLADFSRACQHLLSPRLVVSATPEAFWRLPVRLTRGLCRLPFLPPSDHCLHQIFLSTVTPWLEGFPLRDPSQVARAMSGASVAVFRSVCERFRPSSLRPHFLVTTRDLLNVLTGLLLLSPDTKAQTRPQFGFLNRRGFQSSSNQNPRKSSQKKVGGLKLRSAHKKILEKRSSRRQAARREEQADATESDSTLRMLARLWCHETTRVYLDRNADSKDRVWFLKLLEACTKYCFCGVGFEDSHAAARDRGGISRQPGTANLGSRRPVRGSRARGGALPQGLPAEGLNEEELAGNGVKVDTLKKLLSTSLPQDEAGRMEGPQPPKLIALDQITVRGEDLTGLIFAQFPSSAILQPPSGTSVSDSSVEEADSAAQVALPTGYTELGDGQVMEVLSKHLETFQKCRTPTDTSCSEEEGEREEGEREEGEEEEEEEEKERGEKGKESEGGDAAVGSEITLYREAIEHCARLYRVMNLPGASALLLGTKGSGRKTLVRLMAHIKKSKVMELDCVGAARGEDGLSFRECLRETCVSAAVDSQHTVLLVSGHAQLSFHQWHDLVTVINEGLCPGLFSSSELLVMSGKLQAGKMKRTAQMAYQAFSRAVRTQLHVFVLWDINSTSGSLFSTAGRGEGGVAQESSLRALFQALCRSCAHMDHYLPWSKHAYSEIAMQWWQQKCVPVRWQEWAETSTQLEAVGSLAAHIHITTCQLLIGTYGELARHLVSPKLFTRCLTATQDIAIRLKEKEMVGVGRLQMALKKLKVVDGVVVELKAQLSVLRPRLEGAEREVQRKMGLITAAKERYMEASRRCKSSEETIDFETTNVKDLSDLVEQKMAEVEPVYQASLEALSSVTSKEILEFTSYRAPPAQLNPLFNTLCMLFDRDESWEECQHLMIAHNFLESLKFFDRDHIPRQKVRRLEKVTEETDRFKNIGTASSAAVPLGMWVCALLDYHRVTLVVEPLKAKLKAANETLINARKTFVEMQKDMFETKGALESTVKQHKDSVKGTRTVESEINDVMFNLEDAQRVVQTMVGQRKYWEEQLSVISDRISCIPGHATLCAGSACYLARVPTDRHGELLANWLGYCSGTVPLGSLASDHKLQAAQGYGAYSGQQQQVVRVQRDFSLAAGLSEKEERATWHQESTFPADSILDRFLSSRAFCSLGFTPWPLVFDTYDQLSVYLGAPEGRCVVLRGSDPSLLDELKVAVCKGRTVLLYVDESRPCSQHERTFLARLLQKQFAGSGEGGVLLSASDDDSGTPVHGQLQLYMVVRRSLRDTVESDSPVPLLGEVGIQTPLNGSVVDLELKDKALQNMLLRFVLSHERPEYLVSHKSLLTDLSLHRQALEAGREAVLEHTLDTTSPLLLRSEELVGVVHRSEASEATAREQIREAERNLHVSEQLVVPYRPLSHYASVILVSLRRVAAALRYFDLGVEEFKRVLSETIGRGKGVRVADHAMSLKAHIIHLKAQLLLTVYRRLQMQVFERHQMLLPLLVALNMQLDGGEATAKEVELLGRDLGSVEAQLDLAGDTGRSSLASKPQWISDKVWCKALQLQREVPPLRRLTIELSDSSTEWKEFFETSPSLLGPLPGFGAGCSMSQKMLLWKIFKPEEFNTLAKEFILVTSGGDFVRTKLASFDRVLSRTEGRSPTFLLQSPGSPDSSLLVGELRGRAAQRGVECRQYSLHGRDRCRQLQEDLPSVSATACWIVIEHCHFLPDCREFLMTLVKELGDFVEVHSRFRLWVIVPVEFVSEHRTSGCKSVTYQEHKISEDTQLSSHLLHDLNSVLCDSAHAPSKHQGVWTSHAATISKLRSFIPTVLSHSELLQLDPQHSSPHSLPSLIYEELCLHNHSTSLLLASLQKASSYLEDRLLLSHTLGRTILSIASDSIPASWTSVLPEPLGHMTSLMTAVKLLRARVEFYRRALNSGTLPSKLNPLLFSAPQNLIFGGACTFAEECQLSMSRVVTEAKLQPDKLAETQLQALALFGLTLRNATWDSSLCCLRPQEAGELPDRNSYCVVISYGVRGDLEESRTSSPGVAGWEESASAVYDCPVVLAGATAGEPGRTGLGVAGHTPQYSSPPLPTLFRVPLSFMGKSSDGVCLLCNSELHVMFPCSHGHS